MTAHKMVPECITMKETQNIYIYIYIYIYIEREREREIGKKHGF